MDSELSGELAIMGKRVYTVCGKWSTINGQQLMVNNQWQHSNYQF